VRTTGGDVSLDGFAGPVEVEVERGSARLSPRAALAAAVKASATHGEVRLEVPEGSRFDLDAESRRGELRADVPGLTTSEKGGERGRGHRATGQLAGGGVAVHLRADGDVVLEAKPRRWPDRRPPRGEAVRDSAAGGGPRARRVSVGRGDPEAARGPGGGGAATAGTAEGAGGAGAAVSVR
jgi:hypothetical protein